MTRTRFGTCLLAVMLLWAGTATIARSAGTLPPLRTPVADLGEPFAGWNVTLTPDDHDDNLLTLEFDSAALNGRRATVLVWLPATYRTSTTDVAVTYFLHGQGDSHSFGVGQALGEAGVPVPYPFGPPGSSRSFGGIDPAGTAAARSFLLVGLDNGPEQWCGHCWWTDSVGPGGVDAERHLLDEVMPLIERLFRVRTDRGGRGILGNSMGANGTLLVGFRHPDRFGFIGALSPTYPTTENRALFTAWAEGTWLLYLADQGYQPVPPDEARYYALDPLFYSGAVVPANPEVMVAMGDGCLPNHGRGLCANEPATGDPEQEFLFRPLVDMWTQSANEHGIRMTYIQREGAHGGPLNHDNFIRYYLPRMNEVFASAPQPPPAQFSYRSVDSEFDIFGWDIAVDRPNLETLHVLGARTDGTEITLAGTGVVRVRTPALSPNTPYVVEINPDGGAPWTIESTSDPAGRVEFAFVLGPARTTNELRELVQLGLFSSPRTSVRIVPA